MTNVTKTMTEKEKLEVVKAGGFYIARYEASAKKEYEKFSKMGETPLGNQTWSNADDAARNLYSTNDNIITMLPYGEMWDRMLAFIGSDGTDLIFGSNWGNHKTYSASATKAKTGSNEAWRKKNIYDLCGNMWEWTQEGGAKGDTTLKVHRGGYWKDTATNYRVSTRGITTATSNVEEGGFRPAFYIKNEIQITKPYIPLGFYYVGGTIDTGLIISEVPEDENKGSSHEAAKKLLGNQFVWVPVTNISEIFDSQFSRYAKLYDFTYSNYGELIDSMLQGANKEPYLMIQDGYQGISNTLTGEFDRVIESIIKYKGFYVGRYESAVFSGSGSGSQTVYSMMGNVPYISNVWFDTYKLSRIYGNNKSGISSTLMYGSLWDTILKWIGSTSIYSSVIENSSMYGNYRGTNEAIGDNNEKVAPCGSSEHYVINNIYDLAGNLQEWTHEVSFSRNEEFKVLRGGNALMNPTEGNIAARITSNPFWADTAGFRLILILD